MTRKNPKPPKHLRIRESSELGGLTRYHGRCGATGLNNREYTKSKKQTTCPKCLERL